MNWLKTKVTANKPLTKTEALSLLNAETSKIPGILKAAEAVRRKSFSNKVHLCSILNAKSGKCSQDCSFCAQSSSFQTKADSYSFLENGEILSAYNKASKLPITNFGIVTSGKALTGENISQICELIRNNLQNQAAFCASFGMLNMDQLKLLKAAGLKRYHHNLETAESFFTHICTTHTFADRKKTVLAAKGAGLEVCSGGIFGLGEAPEERVELAFALKELQVDSIPLNFLVPIPNTPAAKKPTLLTPREILKTIAMFRLVCRKEEIKVCAGRERYLGSLEHDIFRAGATGMMIGGYLTVQGRLAEEDLKMINEAGLET